MSKKKETPKQEERPKYYKCFTSDGGRIIIELPISKPSSNQPIKKSKKS